MMDNDQINGLLDESKKLEESTLNRTNIEFTRKAIDLAKLLETNTQFERTEEIENLAVYKIAMLMVENKRKLKQVNELIHLRLVVPYFKEFSRFGKYSEENPNGEEAVVQKLLELEYIFEGTQHIVDLLYVNDSVGEKKDTNDAGESSESILWQSIAELTSEPNSHPYTNKSATLKSNPNIRISTTSIEEQIIARGNNVETRARFESRVDGKITERKGGAVLAGLEIPWEDDGSRHISAFTDGDAAHMVATFLGDAIFQIVNERKQAYLANLRAVETFICRERHGSVIGEPDNNSVISQISTAERVQRRKLFLSGFLMRVFFGELKSKYGYTGTTNLPAKVFDADAIDFSELALNTVGVNVDVGIITALLNHFNQTNYEKTIGSGPLVMRENISSSTMTLDDIASEFSKVYGPIFKTVVTKWLENNTDMINDDISMQLKRDIAELIQKLDFEGYNKLFVEVGNVHASALFNLIENSAQGEIELNEIYELLKHFIIRSNES